MRRLLLPVGPRLGDKIINEAADMYGLGQPTGVDLFGEKAGWLSGEEEYNRRFKSRGWVWTMGLDMDMAIGQTQLVTPIQLASLIGALGNGRYVYRPYLRKEVRNSNGIVIAQQSPTVSKTLSLDSTVIATLHKSLIEVMAAAVPEGALRFPTCPLAEKPEAPRTRKARKRMHCSWAVRLRRSGYHHFHGCGKRGPRRQRCCAHCRRGAALLFCKRSGRKKNSRLVRASRSCGKRKIQNGSQMNELCLK